MAYFMLIRTWSAIDIFPIGIKYFQKFIYIYVYQMDYVNAATRSAQHTHARMITTFVEKVQT